MEMLGNVFAQIAKGFQMQVYAYDPFVDKKNIEKDGVIALDKIEDLYSKCDYISLHIPANEKTKKSINYSLLSKMPKKATLLNTARKEVIDEEGLLKIMEERSGFKYVSDIAPSKTEDFEKYKERVFFYS